MKTSNITVEKKSSVVEKKGKLGCAPAQCLTTIPISEPCAKPILSEEWDNISLGSFQMDYERSNKEVEVRVEETNGKKMLGRNGKMKSYELTLVVQRFYHPEKVGTRLFLPKKGTDLASSNRKSKRNKKKYRQRQYKMWKKAAGEAMQKMAELITMGVDVGDESSGSEGSDGSDVESI